VTWTGIGLALKTFGGTALGFVSGIKVWLILGAITAASAFVLYLWIDNGRLEAQRDLARRDVADTKIIIAAMLADNALAASLVEVRNAKMAELKGDHDALVQKIRQQPATRACASSGPFRVLLNGLQPAGKNQTR